MKRFDDLFNKVYIVDFQQLTDGLEKERPGLQERINDYLGQPCEGSYIKASSLPDDYDLETKSWRPSEDVLAVTRLIRYYGFDPDEVIFSW